MEFRVAIDQLGARVKHKEVADALGVSVASVRQYRLSPGARAHRTPPDGWPGVLAQLARKRGRKLEALAEKLAPKKRRTLTFTSLQIRLMRREAEVRLQDAEILSKATSLASDSDYLLELLAFELLLKATVLIHTRSCDKSHHYLKLFASLPANVKDQLRKRASQVADTPIDMQELERLLAAFERNFVDLRYPFDAYSAWSESDYHGYGELWIELGSPTEEAEFQYYPEELRGLVLALREEVDAYLAQEKGESSDEA